MNDKDFMLTYCIKGGKFQTEYFPTREKAVERAEWLARGSQRFSIAPKIHNTNTSSLEKLKKHSFNQQSS